jgi:hypothetical protein
MARRPVEITWEALKSGEDISSLLQEVWCGLIDE